METQRSHRTYRSYIRRRISVAYLHPVLRALLVERFQLVSECNRDDSLVGHCCVTYWFDVGDLGYVGNQTL